MKKIFVFMALFSIVLAGMALAENVAVVVEMPDGITVNKQCVNVNDGASAYDILTKTKNTFVWSSPSLYGHALCKVNGVGDDVSGTVCSWGQEFWSFFIYDSGWKASPVGFDGIGGCWNKDYGSFIGHYCGSNGAMIGLARVSTSSNNSLYLNQPPDVTYGSICGLSIEKIDAKVDGEKDSDVVDTIGKKAKPGSAVELKIKMENLFSSSQDIEIEDVTVTVESTEDIGDDTIDEESDTFDLSEGKTKTVTIDFDIPSIVDEDDYVLVITAEGDGTDGLTYADKAEITLTIKKDKHEIDITEFSIAPAVLKCERKATASFELMNIGS